MSQRTNSNAYRQEQRRAQADAQNAELEANFAELRNILNDALSRDAYIDLDKLKTTPRIEPFKKKKPRRGNYVPAAPAGMSKMLPWKKREYEQLHAEGETRYERAEREHQRAKTDHEIRMNLRRNQAFEQNQKIERIQERFSAGESKAIEDYFLRVLQNGSYPESFPRQSQLVYTANSRQLSIEHDLPSYQAVPAAKAYRYVKARDEITQPALPQSQRKQLYVSVLAQIALRTIHEIYSADRTERIDTIIFSGFVDKIHPGTGKNGRFCLTSVSTTRHQFLDLNLELVDPLQCLKHLNGRISRKPEVLIAVEPLEVVGDTKTPAVSLSDRDCRRCAAPRGRNIPSSEHARPGARASGHSHPRSRAERRLKTFFPHEMRATSLNKREYMWIGQKLRRRRPHSCSIGPHTNRWMRRNKSGTSIGARNCARAFSCRPT